MSPAEASKKRTSISPLLPQALSPPIVFLRNTSTTHRHRWRHYSPFRLEHPFKAFLGSCEIISWATPSTGNTYRQREYSQGADQNATSRVDSFAHTYTFHTAVLRVSKDLCEEASEVLYERNQFVLVSHLWDEESANVERLKHYFDAPIVSKTQRFVDTFTMHTLHLTIKHPDSKPNQPRISFLVLQKDLPSFSHMIQWLRLQMGWPATVWLPSIDGDGGPKWQMEVPVHKAVRTKLHFTSNRSTSLGLEVFLLKEYSKETPLQAISLSPPRCYRSYEAKKMLLFHDPGSRGPIQIAMMSSGHHGNEGRVERVWIENWQAEITWIDCKAPVSALYIGLVKSSLFPARSSCRPFRGRVVIGHPSLRLSEPLR